MDISGVDVDNLSNEEILNLCSGIADCNGDEIFVLDGVDVNNLSDDKTQEFYEDVMYSQNVPLAGAAELTEGQVLDNEYNIIDTDADEIVLANGQKVDIDNLTDDEILALYNDCIDSIDGNNMLISYVSFGWNCSNASYHSASGTYHGRITTDCLIPLYNGGTAYSSYTLYLIIYLSGSGNHWDCKDAAAGNGVITANCGGYLQPAGFCYSSIYKTTSYQWTGTSVTYRCK